MCESLPETTLHVASKGVTTQKSIINLINHASAFKRLYKNMHYFLTAYRSQARAAALLFAREACTLWPGGKPAKTEEAISARMSNLTTLLCGGWLSGLVSAGQSNTSVCVVKPNVGLCRALSCLRSIIAFLSLALQQYVQVCAFVCVLAVNIYTHQKAQETSIKQLRIRLFQRKSDNYCESLANT